jgi:hypothetical protein
MADEKVSLAFVLDEAAQKRVEQRVSTLAEELAKLGVTMEQLKGGKFGDQIATEVENAAQATKTKLNPALVDTKKVIKEAQAEAALLQKQVAAMGSDLEKARIAALRDVAGRIESIGRGALAGGAAVSGGIFLAAKNYIKDAEQSDRLTRKWLSSTLEIENAQKLIGRVAAQAVLPFLEKAADVSSKVAGFVEKHPEIVEAAFNTGLFVAGFGALSLAVSRGIKLFADARYLLTIPAQLQAARLQDQAANKQLEAALLRAKELGINIPTPAKTAATGAGGVLATAVPIIGGSLLAGGLSVAMEKELDAIEKLFSDRFGKLGQIVDDALAAPLARILPGFGLIRSLDTIFQRFTGNIKDVGDAAEEAGKAAGRAIGRLKGSENEQEVVAAWQKFQADIAQIEQEAAAERKQIIESAERQIADITRKYNQQRADINARFSANRTAIIRDFNEESAKAEIDYAKQRADIIKDSGQEIRDIEERHQENIRKLTLDHAERMADLTASRDALGLVKEQRRFDREVSESEREANQEIAKRKQQTAERLQELAAEFAQERAQRQAEFAQRLAENEQRRQEELKQAAEAHQRELEQAREAERQKLLELQQSLNAERLRRREVFIAEIKDLDSSLIRERGLKQQYYSVMLEDAQRFLTAYRSRLPSAGTVTGSTGGTTPIHDYTGWAYTGLYRMAANGQPQWVMSGAASRAAEQIIGGRLTQDAMLSALARGSGRGSSRTVNYNDQRRFNASIPLSERRAIARETAEMIAQELT